MAASTVKPLLEEEDESELFLSSDIVINILKRLPVKSILRFRCVCKDWNDLFKTSFFIKQHLHHSIHHRGTSLLLHWGFHYYDVQFSLLYPDNKTLIPLNAPPNNGRHIRIIGCSHGLVCLHKRKSDSLFVWNPATRELQPVPTLINRSYYDHAGFGFNTVVNGYKIVTIFEHAYTKAKRVGVYSSSTGSWKIIESGNLGFVILPGTFTATDEVMYWVALKLRGDPSSNNMSVFIVAFDIVKEEFTVISRPIPNFHGCKKLITYENKPALLSEVKLCVMKEAVTSGRSGQRWNDSIDNSSALYPLAIWRNEAVFGPNFCHLIPVSPKPSCAIHLFNLTTKKLSDCIIISPRNGDVRGAFNYVESLVSIGNTIQE